MVAGTEWSGRGGHRAPTPGAGRVAVIGLLGVVVAACAGGSSPIAPASASPASLATPVGLVGPPATGEPTVDQAATPGALAGASSAPSGSTSPSARPGVASPGVASPAVASTPLVVKKCLVARVSRIFQKAPRFFKAGNRQRQSTP